MASNQMPRLGPSLRAAMALRVKWYCENAKDCERRAEQSRDRFTKAAYQELVRAWNMLAESAEQLASEKSIRPDLVPTFANP
jgi:hypothetical protein